ncbi:rRNA pseudouridine synthase [Candidatus Sumerlaeota bacterium]|nr:rRNA pseudouridine synthase [Candidatus Sumerlaeota bacterium]
MRLNRYLAQCGAGSRRSVEDFIREGRVRLNGAVTREMGTQVDPASDRVELDGKEVRPAESPVYIMLNKPAGYDVTRRDPHSGRTIFDLLPSDLPASVQAVGRLDRDTTGLLLLTNDGELAFRLTHPRHGVEKEYLCFGPRPATRDQLDQLVSGVALDDGLARALKAENVETPSRALRMVVSLGRKRIIRRLCKAVGFELTALHRSRVGPIALGDLQEGNSRGLTAHEIAGLRNPNPVLGRPA